MAVVAAVLCATPHLPGTCSSTAIFTGSPPGCSAPSIPTLQARSPHPSPRSSCLAATAAATSRSEWSAPVAWACLARPHRVSGWSAAVIVAAKLTKQCCTSHPHSIRRRLRHFDYAGGNEKKMMVQSMDMHSGRWYPGVATLTDGKVSPGGAQRPQHRSAGGAASHASLYLFFFVMCCHATCNLKNRSTRAGLPGHHMRLVASMPHHTHP